MRKKIISILVIIMLLVGTATAQVFILENDGTREARDVNGELIIPSYGSTNDQYLPIGDGSALFICLGTVYIIGKKRRKK